MAIALPRSIGLERSFERLYREHVDAVHRYTLAALGNRRDAEDATQTTFLNAYSALRRGERAREPGSWLIAIARNVCRQRYRHQSRRPTETELPLDLPGSTDASSPVLGDVLAAVRQLPFRQRAAFVMHDLNGYSREEVARSLGVSPRAVQMLLGRGRSAVRELLEEDIGCEAAGRAIADQLAGTITVAERAALRAHLRRCDACVARARSRRARGPGIKAVAWLPLPGPVASLLGSGSAAVTVPAATVPPVAGGLVAGGVLLKAAAVLATGAIVASGGYEIAQRTSKPAAKPAGGATTAQNAGVAHRPVARTQARRPATGAGRLAAHHVSARADAQRPTARSHGIARACGLQRESCPSPRASKGPAHHPQAGDALPGAATHGLRSAAPAHGASDRPLVHRSPHAAREPAAPKPKHVHPATPAAAAPLHVPAPCCHGQARNDHGSSGRGHGPDQHSPAPHAREAGAVGPAATHGRRATH